LFGFAPNTQEANYVIAEFKGKRKKRFEDTVVESLLDMQRKSSQPYMHIDDLHQNR
jgi:hypothetical protein